MIRLRNLDVGSGKFNGSRVRGILANPFGVSTDSPMLDLQDINWSMTTGWTGIRMTMAQRDVAQASGTNFTARFRAENRVDTSIGTLCALECYAQNRNTSASLAVMGFSATADARGVSASLIRGVEIIAANTEGTGTLTTMVGARIRVVGAGTITNGPWGLQIVNDAASALASPVQLQAFVICENASGTAASECFADLTLARVNRTTGLYSVSLTADDNVLFYYKDKDGTAHAVVATDGDALALRT